MGLSNDIYEVMKTSMESDVDLDDVQDNNLYNTAAALPDINCLVFKFNIYYYNKII